MTRPAGWPALPEPRGAAPTAELFATYLTFFRETVAAKLLSLPEPARRASVLPSGWSPLELVWHLAHMERRWFVWGFAGEPVEAPWGDERDERWYVADHLGAEEVVALLRRHGERTTALLAEHDLDEVAPPGPRFEAEPPTLARICFHVLQEYARHAGHLDVAVELADGPTGE